jgi:hypothetical protein
VGTTKRMSSARAQAVSMPVRPGARETAAEPCKVTDILVSIGEVPYEWDIRSDALAWGANARHVLKVADAAAIATNGAFARLTCADNTQSRRDAVLLSGQRDAGAGVPYQVQYSIVGPPAPTALYASSTSVAPAKSGCPIFRASTTSPGR